MRDSAHDPDADSAPDTGPDTAPDPAIRTERDNRDENPRRLDRVTRRLNGQISQHPWRVVVVFVLLTGVFLAGIGGGGGQQAGADQFTEDLEEAQALEDMQENFQQQQRSTGGSTATLFVEDTQNVLAKPSLLRILTAQQRLETHDRLRVTATRSPASNIATQLDPEATTTAEQYRAVERASDRQVTAAIQAAHESGSLGAISTDFQPTTASASVAQVGVTYDTPPQASSDDNARLQQRTVAVVGDIDGLAPGENVIVFGDAIINQEILNLLTDTAIIVFPAALLLITFFLVVAYRDPIDLGLGIVALVMTMIWTFGFMGYANIPFSDTLVTVFPLLMAVGIDFGIHIVNRYREERVRGTSITDSMGITTTQLTAAFLIVTITTIFGFIANLTSSLDQLQDFGIVAAVGILFTLLIFGVFLPAVKVGFDKLRTGSRVPQFGTRPLGRDDSLLGYLLPIGTSAARIAPVVVIVAALLLGATGAAYGTGVDTEFSEEAFFPDSDRIEQYQRLPAPLAPSEYTFMAVLSYLENDFDQGFIGTVTLYIEDQQVRSDMALEDINRAIQDPPAEFAQTDRRADATSILSVIDAQAAADPSFAALVERSDRTGNGVPDRNVDQIYGALLASSAGDRARQSITTDRHATRIEYQLDVETDQTEATQAAQHVADEMRLTAVPTGQLVVNQVVIDRITASAITSLIVAFLLTALFLMVSYRLLEGRAIYGVINLVPVLVSVGLLAGSMRYFDIPLTPFNAPILAVSIGLGVDYTVHFMHRFVDEFETTNDIHTALRTTAHGTGGALTGSMLTTVCGLGTLYLALIPLVADFGILLALGVLYAYLASLLVLPSVIVIWHRLETNGLPTR